MSLSRGDLLVSVTQPIIMSGNASVRNPGCQADATSNCSENQVRPFSLTTADDETLYAWHILPLPLYSQHETQLSAQPSGFSSNIEESLNFKLLSEDPNARLVLYCKFHSASDRKSHADQELPVHGVSLAYPRFGGTWFHPFQS